MKIELIAKSKNGKPILNKDVIIKINGEQIFIDFFKFETSVDKPSKWIIAFNEKYNEIDVEIKT